MRDQFFDFFDDVFVRTTPRSLLTLGALRLDASFYDAPSQAAYAAMRVNGLSSDALSSLSDVYRSNLRERVFVEQGCGIPLLTGSSLGVDDDENQKYVSRTLTRGVKDDTLFGGDILISAAGTVGKVELVWKNHEGKIGGEDLVRIRVKDRDFPFGYLYTFFRSPLGNAVFSHHAAGSVVSRVYPDQIAALLIPRLDPSVESEINTCAIESFDCRHAAKELLTEAFACVLESNHLPPLPAEREDEPEAFAIPSSMLSLEGSEFRLEAHYYNSVARTAIGNIQNLAARTRTVGQLSHDVILGWRSKRNYVESAYGTPLLAGKNIIQIIPADLKHISNSETEDLKDMLLSRGWILVTRSGTIGRTCFVWHNYENFAASEHILRIIPRDDEIDGAYLYAFLSSEYGYKQIVRFRHGSVIDEITDDQLQRVIVPVPASTAQEKIGGLVRKAFEKRADALRLEEKAQRILMAKLRPTNVQDGQHV